MGRSLEDILIYEMTPNEAKAYKLALLWEELTEKEFPGEKISKLRKTGDPRQSFLFKCCHKLATERQGIIPDKEFKLYIMAQLQILKSLKDGKGVHALIDPVCLTGDPSWKRWKLWKYHFDKRMKEYQTVDDVGVKAGESRVLAELENSKKFLVSKIGQPNLESMKLLMKDFTLVRWITLEKVSPYYVILSPLVSKALNGKSFEEHFMFDLSIYKTSITDDIKVAFRKNFAYEFIE